MKVLHKPEDINLTLNIDPEFTGILLGFAHDESEGCELKGELVIEVLHKTTIKGLLTTFSGTCQVNFKTTNAIGVPLFDGVENHLVIRKTIRHFDEYIMATDPNCPVKSTIFEPGTYKYPFSFNISASIPHTFKGKHGSIEYDLSATALRGAFSSNLHISRPIILRRCLMDELDPESARTQTVQGTTLGEILTYSASAPSMVYSEGGLLKLDLHVELKDPSRYSVRMVTCGLQEKVYYRTSGKNASQHPMHYNDFSFPLGCSTFFPSKHPDYNPADLHNYNAIFRLYPRVRTDNRSSLIVVQHALMIRMVVDDNEVIEKSRRGSAESTHSVSSMRSLSPKAILSHFTAKQNDHHLTRTFSSLTDTGTDSEENEHDDPDFTRTPSLSRSPSISESIGSMSGESLATSPRSIAVALEQLHPFQSNIVRVSSRKSNTQSDDNNDDNDFTPSHDNHEIDDEGHHIGHSLIMHHHFNPLKFHKGTLEEGSYECRLSVPVIVTSRQEYREGSIPAIPDYETTVDEPPSYLASLQTLPPVPIYPSEDDASTTSISTHATAE